MLTKYYTIHVMSHTSLARSLWG